MIGSQNFTRYGEVISEGRNNPIRSGTLKIIGIALGLVLLLDSPTYTHEYWYEVQGQDYVLYRGHHLIKHGGEALVPYDPRVIKKVSCATPEGVVRTLAPPFYYPLRISGPCTALSVEMDSGFWSETWTETLNQPKDEVSEAVVSWQTFESTQLLNAWTDAPLPKPLSDGLEILLEKNPFELRNGQKLRLVVMLRGQPREGVTVAYDGKPRGITGPHGRINIRIRHGGLQVLTGSLKEPPLDPKKADKLIHATTLFFKLPEEPQ